MTGLWDLIQRRAAEAHACGVMYRIESEPHLVRDAGVDFVVRVAIDYAAQAARQPKSRPGNPFADPEPELFVADVSETHRALLNKYHVIESHLLVVTREFVDQEVLLDRADFEALAACLPAGVNAIGFYNGGRVAGASQAHKHLQVVTLPVAPWADLPMEPVLAAEPRPLPFRHAFARISSHDPRELHETYRELLLEIGVQAIPDSRGERQSSAYNMLLTRDWMMAVPRSRDDFERASINSIAYAGGLFVREPHQLEAIRAVGPMAVLAQVGYVSR